MSEYLLENDADLAIALLWACATDEDIKFAGGAPTDSVYTSYYQAAYQAAWVAVSKWLLHEAGVTYGYSQPYTVERGADTLRLAEEILATMASWGPEPVRQLRRGAIEARPDTGAYV